MRNTIITLLVMLLASVVIAEVTNVTTKPSRVDVLTNKEAAKYKNAVAKAEATYAKLMAKPIKQYGKARDKSIIWAGDKAIRNLKSSVRGASPLEVISIEQEIERITDSLDEKVGNAPKVTQKASVLEACGVKFQGHTYLAIVSSVKVKEANLLCRKMGGHLVYIETIEELIMMKRLFGTYRLWTGASKVKGQWKWGNGKSVDPRMWVEGCPKNYTHGVIQGELIDTISKGTSFGFICEWE